MGVVGPRGRTAAGSSSGGGGGKFPLVFGGDVSSGGGTWYANVGTQSEAMATAPEPKVNMPFGGTISRMHVKELSGTGPDVDTRTYTLRKNGVDTALQVVLGVGFTESTDVVNSVAFNIDDDLSVSATNDGINNAANNVLIEFLVVPS